MDSSSISKLAALFGHGEKKILHDPMRDGKIGSESAQEGNLSLGLHDPNNEMAEVAEPDTSNASSLKPRDNGNLMEALKALASFFTSKQEPKIMPMKTIPTLESTPQTTAEFSVRR